MADKNLRPERSREALVADLEAIIDYKRRWQTDPIGAFETLADAFYRITGCMAPGKSQPLEMCGNERYRNQQWDEFVRAQDLVRDELIREAAALLRTPPREADASAESFWQFADRNAQEVSKMPPWVKGGGSQRTEALRERAEAAERWCNDAGRAYAPCVEHQPDAWEGDGTCVICEGYALKARAEAAEGKLAALDLTPLTALVKQPMSLGPYSDARDAAYVDGWNECLAQLAAVLAEIKK